jgi:hypothetical protein
VAPVALSGHLGVDVLYRDIDYQAIVDMMVMALDKTCWNSKGRVSLGGFTNFVWPLRDRLYREVNRC